MLRIDKNNKPFSGVNDELIHFRETITTHYMKTKYSLLRSILPAIHITSLLVQ